MFFPYGYYGYGMNGSLLLVLLAAVLGVLAQSAVQKQYKKYSAVHALSGVTAAQAAQTLLSQAGIYDVRIERSGRAGLSDHYDPKSKTLRLSDGVMNSASIAALGVAAHECGHAMQHDQEYLPLRMRNSLVPMVNLASNLSMPLFIIGLLMSFSQLAMIGAALYFFGVVFQLITLPVELNASSRALNALESTGLLTRDELPGARKVLTAAASTYIAAALMSIAQFLRLYGIASRDRR